MKIKTFILLFLLSNAVFSQAIVDAFKVVNQVNDSTWLVESFNIYESEILNTSDTRIDTVLVPEQTVYFDSSGIIRHLLTVTTNEQNEISAKVSRSFDAPTSLRNVVKSNIDIATISKDSSNYFEETAKFFSNQLIGKYRIFYDSSGVQLKVLADLSLISNQFHPDGRAMRLTFPDGRFFTVQIYHRWRWRIVNWPFGEDTFSWHRITPPTSPIYRPEDYSTSPDKYTRITKVR